MTRIKKHLYQVPIPNYIQCTLPPTLTAVQRGCVREYCRVSEPACFGAALAPGIFYPEPAPALAPGKREHNFRIFEK